MGEGGKKKLKNESRSRYELRRCLSVLILPVKLGRLYWYCRRYPENKKVYQKYFLPDFIRIPDE